MVVTQDTRSTDHALLRILDRCEIGLCWEWSGGLDKDGYGKTTIDRADWRVHRAVWTALVGPLDSTLVIDHLCRNRVCCNPDHLEPVSDVENWRRSHAPSRIYADRSTCKNGHDLNSPENLRKNKAGARVCKICYNEWQAEKFKSMSPEAREVYNAKQRARYAKRKARA